MSEVEQQWRGEVRGEAVITLQGDERQGRSGDYEIMEVNSSVL